MARKFEIVQSAPGEALVVKEDEDGTPRVVGHWVAVPSPPGPPPPEHRRPDATRGGPR